MPIDLRMLRVNRVCTKPWKCSNLKVKLFMPGKSWLKALILEKAWKRDIVLLEFSILL